MASKYLYSIGKTMRNQIILLTIFLLMITPAFAENTIYQCIDANTSYAKHVLDINDQITTIEENNTCSFGCDSDNGLCMPDPKAISTTSMIIPIIVLIVAGLLFYIGTHVSDSYNVIALWVFVVALFLLAMDMSMIITMATDANLTGQIGYLSAILMALIITIIFIVFLLILKYIMDAIKALGGSKAIARKL